MPIYSTILQHEHVHSENNLICLAGNYISRIIMFKNEICRDHTFINFFQEGIVTFVTRDDIATLRPQV